HGARPAGRGTRTCALCSTRCRRSPGGWSSRTEPQRWPPTSAPIRIPSTCTCTSTRGRSAERPVGRRPLCGSELELEPHVAGDVAELLVEAVGIGPVPIGGQLHEAGAVFTS